MLTSSRNIFVFCHGLNPRIEATISMAKNPSQDVGNRSTLRASEILWKVVVTRCENL